MNPSGIDHGILVIDDDPGIRRQLCWCLDSLTVHEARDRKEAITQLRLHQPALVLLDLGLPPDPGGASEGLSTLAEILSLAPDTRIIVITGNDEHINAVRAISEGAHDYFQKPVDPDTLLVAVERALRVCQLEQESKRLHQPSDPAPLQGILAGSQVMLDVCRTVEKVAPSNISTLLLGESGTGKELLACAIHQISPRAQEQMVAINCAAIPETLLESELFGFEKGAFTGASKQTSGKIEYANNGTLFLDEIGDMPLELQAKLLRFLQERVIERVGGRQPIPVDVRLIAATHKDLEKEIAEGRFREDLFYRISEICIKVPALRDRGGDTVRLARALLLRYSEELSKPTKTLSQAALQVIEQHPWPGNVRELENRIKRAVIMAEGNIIQPVDLELAVNPSDVLPLNLKKVRSDAERSAVDRALSLSANNVSQAARMLGVTRPTLYDLMGKYNLRAEKQ